MRTFWTSRAAIGAALLAMAPLAQSRAAAVLYDGNYTVEVRTEHGTCDKATRIPLIVVHGRVTALAGLPMTASGEISERGVVALILAYNGEKARVAGHMKGTSGDGTWSSKPTVCEGHWHAERLG